jgi:hypothetical protein
MIFATIKYFPVFSKARPEPKARIINRLQYRPETPLLLHSGRLFPTFFCCEKVEPQKNSLFETFCVGFLYPTRRDSHSDVPQYVIKIFIPSNKNCRCPKSQQSANLGMFQRSGREPPSPAGGGPLCYA